ncbi:hypothetical protein, partial [Methanosarcina mazei]|uniref:hypothetical protein n=1 Tax=Methanosarcina mazei TaxID=2209 RepID=UPI0012D4040E
MLNEGNNILPYKPYKSDKSYILCTNESGEIEELRSLPNGVKDEVNAETGKKIQRTGKVILDGSEDWVQYLEDTEGDYVRGIIVSWQQDNNSAYFAENNGGAIAYNNEYNNFNIITDLGNAPSIGTVSDGRLMLSLPKTETGITDITSLKNYLSNNPLTLIYQLAESKTYEIEGVNSIQSFDGITHVTFEPVVRFEEIADQNGEIITPYSQINFIESVHEKILDGEGIRYVDASYSQVDNVTVGGLTYGKKYRITYHYPKELGMYMITEIATPATASSENIANKVN